MLASGQTIDHRYDVLETLGQGGMGCVYRVRHRELDREYALKVLAGSAAEAQFREEAKLLAGLTHPALPRVIDYFAVKKEYHLVMDYVPGDDLQAALDARIAAGTPFTPADVLPWLRQLLEVLAFLHVRQVTHRDIKPANIKITPEGRLVLVDFGIAKVGGPATPGRTGFHARGAYTPYMAAPEQVMGQPTGPRTDLFGVGATFTYLLTGQLPPDPRALPAPLGPLLARAMAPDPAGRWADATAMAQALPGAVAAVAPPASPLAGGPLTTGRRDIRRQG